MWDGFCGELIRSRNRNLLRSSLLLAIAPLVFLGVFHRYYSHFFHSVEVTSIAAITAMSEAAAADRFVKVSVDSWVPTGVDQHGTPDKYSSEDRFDGTYMLAKSGGHAMLIFIDHRSSAKSLNGRFFEGVLVPLSSRAVFKADMVSAQSENGSQVDARRYAPVFLNTVHYRQFGRFWLIVVAAFLVPMLAMLVAYLWRVGDPAHHPFARFLASHGALALVVPQVDADMASPHATVGCGNKRVEVGKVWLIKVSRFSAAAMQLDRIVWFYYLKGGRDLFDAVAHDVLGRTIQLPDVSLDTASAFSRAIAGTVAASKAMSGYDARFATVWRKLPDKSQFVAAASALMVLDPISKRRKLPPPPLQTRSPLKIAGYVLLFIAAVPLFFGAMAFIPAMFIILIDKL